MLDLSFDLEYSNIIVLYPKDNTSLPVQIGLITVGASHKMPRAYISVLGQPGPYRSYTTAHFHLQCFMNMCKTIHRFYKHDIIGNDYSLGLSSYMMFANGGRPNQFIIITFL